MYYHKLRTIICIYIHTVLGTAGEYDIHVYWSTTKATHVRHRIRGMGLYTYTNFKPTVRLAAGTLHLIYLAFLGNVRDEHGINPVSATT